MCTSLSLHTFEMLIQTTPREINRAEFTYKLCGDEQHLVIQK